jgi:hypothetical protein
MSEHKGFTPGPWIFRRMEGFEERSRILGRELSEHEGYMRSNDGDWMVVWSDGGLASVQFKGKAKRGQGYQTPDPEGMANARLIAAAPDLLAENVALRELLAFAVKHGSHADNCHQIMNNTLTTCDCWRAQAAAALETEK